MRFEESFYSENTKFLAIYPGQHKTTQLPRGKIAKQEKETKFGFEQKQNSASVGTNKNKNYTLDILAGIYKFINFNISTFLKETKKSKYYCELKNLFYTV